MSSIVFKHVKYLYIIVVSFFAYALSAQEQHGSPCAELYHTLKEPTEKLNIGASLRLRYEHQENFNYKQYGEEFSDDLLLERIWLNLNYHFTDNANVFVRLQDSRFWSGEFDDDDFGRVSAYANPLDIREAYFQWKHLGGYPVGIKGGRQIIAYGDGRVWGPGNWNNRGKFTWDAAKILWDSEALMLDTIYAQRVIPDQDRLDREHYDFHAGGIYASIKNLPCTWDLFYLLKYNHDDVLIGESGIGRTAINSVGTRIKGSAFEWLDYDATVAGQFGDWGADRIQAFGAASSLGHSFDAAWNPGIYFGYAYASGDSNPNDGIHETFDPMFGSAACFFGRMNFFSWKNLHDCQIDFKVKPTDQLNMTLAFHSFWLAEAEDAWYVSSGKAFRRDKTGGSGTEMGQEIDLTGSYTFNDHLKLEAGYSHFFSGDFIQNTGEHKDADWVFLQTTVSL